MKSARLEIRMKKEVKEIVQYAADIMGISLTDFVINSALGNAYKIIKEHKEVKKILKQLS